MMVGGLDMNGAIVFLAVVLLLIAGGAAWGIYRLKRTVRDISRAAFGTDSFREGLERQEILMEETPKSVNGMTDLCLPRIERDFPEFQWPQWRQHCEMVLKSYLQAVEKREVSLLAEGLPELRRQVEFEIEEQKGLDEQVVSAQDASDRNCRRRSYQQSKIHRTEIAGYQKMPGKRVIQVQSSVEYRNRFTQKKVQTRFNMELVYIQDLSKIKESVTAVGAVCPNCGAPITALGNRSCEYCGSAVEPVDVRVWRLHRIEEAGD